MSRAYRISFNPKVSKFVLEFHNFLGIVWDAARSDGLTLEWPTYDAARAYVKDVGLDKVYEDFTAGPAWKKPAKATTIENYLPPEILSDRMRWTVGAPN